MGKRAEGPGAVMHMKWVRVLSLALALIFVATGCGEEEQLSAPTSADFVKEREALAARQKSAPTVKPGVKPVVAEAIADGIGWPPVFALATLAAVAAFALSFTLSEHREPPAAHEELPTLWSIVRTRRALWFMTITALGGAAEGAQP